jgi:hypothetical protein
LVAASTSLWKEVSTIQKNGKKKISPSTQAQIPSQRLPVRPRGRFTGAAPVRAMVPLLVAVAVELIGHSP